MWNIGLQSDIKNLSHLLMDDFLEIDPDFIKYLNQYRSNQSIPELSRRELVVIYGAISGKTYKELENKFSFAQATMKQQASELWKWMRTIFVDYKVSKPNFASLYPYMVAIAKEQLGGVKPSSFLSSKSIGMIPAVTDGFYGRHEELEKFHSALRNRRFVNIHGMSGIGKRTFVAHYLHSKPFSLIDKYVVWVHQDLPSEIWGILEGLNDPEISYFCVLEHGNALRNDVDRLFSLRESLGESAQMVVISERPLKGSWLSRFPLSTLSLAASARILSEFGVNQQDDNDSTWNLVLDCLGGNPGFIRNYLEWVVSTLGITQTEFIPRPSVQQGVLEIPLFDMLNSYDAREIELLRLLASFDEPVEITDIIRSIPDCATRLSYFCRAGMVEERLKPDNTVPIKVYRLLPILKKFILS